MEVLFQIPFTYLCTKSFWEKHRPEQEVLWHGQGCWQAQPGTAEAAQLTQGVSGRALPRLGFVCRAAFTAFPSWALLACLPLTEPQEHPVPAQPGYLGPCPPSQGCPSPSCRQLNRPSQCSRMPFWDNWSLLILPGCSANKAQLLLWALTGWRRIFRAWLSSEALEQLPVVPEGFCQSLHLSCESLPVHVQNKHFSHWKRDEWMFLHHP